MSKFSFQKTSLTSSPGISYDTLSFFLWHWIKQPAHIASVTYKHSIEKNRILWVPMNRILWVQLCHLRCKVLKLVNPIGTQVPPRSRSCFIEQNMSLGNILYMHAPKPAISLCILRPCKVVNNKLHQPNHLRIEGEKKERTLEQIEQDSRACIQSRLQQRPQASRWMNRHNVHSMLLCILPPCLLRHRLRQWIPRLPNILIVLVVSIKPAQKGGNFERFITLWALQ